MHYCAALATNPGCRPKTPYAAPIWFCSKWGLPCRARYQTRGALLPHPFNVTGSKPSRPAFCCTVPEQAITPLPAGRYPAPFKSWSPDFPRQYLHIIATGRPSGALYLVIPRSLSSIKDNSSTRHSPSMTPSIFLGRKRRWKAMTASFSAVIS